MAVAELLVCEVIRRRLGDDGLAELAACLWAVDCQSCGRLLGSEPPSVCVDDLAGVVIASLHHQRCRAPVWDQSMMAISRSGPYTTFVARLVLFQGSGDDEKRHSPLMVVNAGLECVQLHRAGSGRWQVGQDSLLAQAGLTPPGPVPPIGMPVDGLVARVTDSTIAVVLQMPPFTVYESPADERVLDAARRQGGVMLAVTPALNPGDLAAAELLAALKDPRTLVGWAGLHGTRLPQRRRRFRLGTEIWVLHWNIQHVSVGRLVRKSPRRLTAGQARPWAERVISPIESEPLAWQPVLEGRPDEGWYAWHRSSGWMYILRRNARGWDLVLSYGQTSAETAETDNEAKAWAAGVLMLQARTSAVTWWPGHSTLGSATLYGTA